MTALLAPARRLDVWLFVVLVVLVATSALRYVVRHGMGTAGVLILAGAAALVAGYAIRPMLPRRSWAPAAWSIVLAALVAALTVVAPSFAWCAVPVAFAVLRTLPFASAVICVSVLMVVITASWLRISPSLDPVVVAGPLGIALITIMSFRALDRESRARAQLIDRLVAAQDDLASGQRQLGAMRERSRLSRDIHDSIGQDLSSIHLLLQAADRGWDRSPAESRSNVVTAIEASRRGLEEIRRVIHDLSTEVEVAAQLPAHELGARLRGVVERENGPAEVVLRVDGDPVPLSDRLSSALVATLRGSLANVREHSGADRAVVTLTYAVDEVRLDISDDGRGFDPSAVSTAAASATGRPGVPDADRGDGASPLRGLGLWGIRERMTDLGGGAEVDSEVGAGTTVSVWFPIGDSRTSASAMDPGSHLGDGGETMKENRR